MVNIFYLVGGAAAIVVVGGSAYLVYRQIKKRATTAKKQPQQATAETMDIQAHISESDKAMKYRPVARTLSTEEAVKSAILGDDESMRLRPQAKPAGEKDKPETWKIPPAQPIPNGGGGPQLVAETSTLPEVAKTMLANAVWYRCENPYCNNTQFLDVHHIISEVEGGTNKLDNLIVLCPKCHAEADNHEIPIEDMQLWIQARVERFKFNLEWPYK